MGFPACSLTVTTYMSLSRTAPVSADPVGSGHAGEGAPERALKLKKLLTRNLLLCTFQTFAGTIAEMKHATIVDIAKRLGISPSTVSRALTDHPDVRRETKEQVKKTADELEYSPNPIARSLKSSRTTTIGVIVPEIKHDFFSSAISGIEEVAYQSGYTIIVCQSNESYEREVVNTNALMHHRVAGVIVSIRSPFSRPDQA
jgi:transcriptional regulator with XRE-family HTH domain